MENLKDIDYMAEKLMFTNRGCMARHGLTKFLITKSVNMSDSMKKKSGNG